MTPIWPLHPQTRQGQLDSTTDFPSKITWVDDSYSMLYPFTEYSMKSPFGPILLTLNPCRGIEVTLYKASDSSDNNLIPMSSCFNGISWGCCIRVGDGLNHRSIPYLPPELLQFLDQALDHFHQSIGES